MLFDVIIVGSGVVGSAMALALAKHTSLRIAVLDAQRQFPAWNPDQIDSRVSAISRASQRFLQNIDVWQDILAKRVSPYLFMEVWGGNQSDLLRFDSGLVNLNALGYIIEDSALRESLHRAFSKYPHLEFLHPITLSDIKEENGLIKLMGNEDQEFKTQLLIAADGAHSWVREQQNFAFKKYDYEQTAIVATVETELSHERTARQRFLATGPLAFLPLYENHLSSIVWSASSPYAESLLAKEDDLFCEALTKAFEGKLGEVKKVSKRFSFPLSMRHVEQYFQSNIVLIGDAAHTIHPLAGQGVNMGLLDAACLFDVIFKTLKTRGQIISSVGLRQYERARKYENQMMLSFVNLINEIYSIEFGLIPTIRNTGIKLVNRMSLLKRFFANFALGIREESPRLTR